MSNKDETSKPNEPKPSAKPRRKSGGARRRTRMLALEPRVLFDGALVADIIAEQGKVADASATQAHSGQADASAKAAAIPGANEAVTVVPATVEVPGAAPTPVPGTPAAERDSSKQGVDASKPAAAAGKISEFDRVSDASGAPAVRHEIVFVDTSVKDYQLLLTDVNPNARIVLLDGSKDGIQQIADFMAHETNVDAIHIVSHGAQGVLEIGTANLNVLSMARDYAGQLAEIGSHLSKGADILVYGCDFGQGGLGNAATTELSWLTGADIASSVDLTGDSALDGNWALERDIGSIETSIAFGERAQHAFHNVLETLDFDKVAWTAGNLTGTYAVGSGNVTITLSGNTGRLAAGNPVEGVNFTGNLIPVENALQVQSSGFATNAEFIDITISFTQPGGVSNVSFNLFDIDTGAFTDKITVTGTNSSGAINPTTIATDSRVAAGSQTWAASGGNTITGVAAAANTGAGAETGTAVVTFNQDGVTQINIRYQNNSGVQTTQTVALHDISFDQAPAAPQIDLNASDSSVSAGDRFVTQSYSNASTGTIPWNNSAGAASSWTETDAAGAGAAAGNVQVVADSPDFELRMTGNGSIAQRAINLSSYASDNLTRLSFNYRSSASVDAGSDLAIVEVSANGGASWTTLDTLDLGVSASGSASYDITAQANANTVVRFRLSGYTTTANEYFYADNVAVTAKPTSFAATYTENGAAVSIANANAGIVDDSTNMSGATATVGSFVSGDTLTWTNQAGIATSYNSATGVLTAAGAASRATYESLLRSVQYSSSSDDPTVNNTNTSRTISVVVTDSSANASNTARSTITVQAVNDAPVLTAGATLGYTEQAAAAVIDNTITLSDADDTQMASGTVTVGNFVAGDTLTWTNAGTVTGAYNAATGVLTLSGTDTLANYQAVMRSVKFNSTSDDPTVNNTKPTRTVTWAATDANSDAVGAKTSVGVTSTINLTAVNDAPVLTAGATLGYTEQAAAAVIDNTITLSDADDTQMASGTVTVGNFVAGDTLTWTNAGTVTGAYNAATGVLTLSGTDTLANYQAVMRSVKFNSTSDDPTVNNTKPTRTVTWAATDANSDAVGAKTSVGVTSTINLTAVNDAPVLTAGATLGYTEQAAAAVIDNTITLSDADDTQMASGTVTVGNFVAGDTLTWTNAGTVTGAYNAATGVLTLSGTDTLANYQAVMRSVKFNSTSDDPTVNNTKPTRTVTWAATDANSDAVGAKTSVGVTSTINLTAVNDAPTVTSGAAGSVTEGAAAGTTVYTATATDPDSPALSYSLSGADAGAFTINSATGVVTINAIPDYETKSSYSFNVVASDGSLTNTQAVTLTVTDVAPGITSATTVSVAEGTSTATVVYTASATDVAGGTVSYALTGADAAAFTVNSATGAVTFNSTPDFETKSSYSFNVKASDPSGAFNTQAVTLTVTDVAPGITSATTVSVAEGTSTATVVYTASATDVAGGTVSYALTGADAAAFTVNSATGAVTFNSTPDFETKSSYSFNVKASDPSGAFNTQAVTLTVTDVAPGITSATTVSVAEGTSTATVVYTASATDVAGGTVSYALTGADAAAFTVNSATGAVTFNSTPDFETKSSYSFNVKASDPSGAFNTQAVTLTVTDVAPGITSATTVSVAEGTSTATVVYTASATDVAGGTVSYALTGADAAAFTVNSATGAVTFNSTPDFETKSSYSFNVKASDPSGAFNTQAVTLTVTDVAPGITSATTVSVAEGTSTATVVYTASATDVAGGTVSYALTGADAAAFTVNSATGAVTFNSTPDFETKSSYSFNVKASDPSGAFNTQAVTLTVTDVAPGITSATTVSVAEGTSTATVVYTASATDVAGGTVSYALTGADAAAFTVNSATGAVTFNSTPDFETKSSYSFNVKASDPSGAFNTQAVTLTVTDVAPGITSATTVSVAEGTSTATVVYTASATDVAGGTVSYALTGADAAAFTVNSATGAVTFNSTPDFETKSSYSFNVKASDPSGAFNTQAVTLTVTDVAPGITSATTVSVAEGTSTATVVYTASATDVAGGTVSYALTGADAAAFTVNSATGAVTFNSTPDFETKSSYSFNVKASDPSGAFNTQAVTLTVTDVAPGITSATTVSVAEGTSTATVVYTASATDVAGGTVSYALTGADAAAFTVNSATGAVTFNSTPDFETKSSYSFNVKASDPSGAFNTQAVTLTVTDVAPGITSATTVSVAEGTSTATVVYTASATDVAGGTVSYALTGADAAAFTVNSATGAVTFNSTPDFETKSSYSFNVKASDPSGAFNTQAVTLTVTDVAPGITSATTVSVAEGTSTATVVYTASATDVAGGTVSYALTGADAAAFTVNSATGAVTFNSTPDFETKSSYSFNVKASDPSGAFNTQAVTLTVTDVAPGITSATTVSVAEGTSTATVVYTASATDVAGGTVSYALTGGRCGGLHGQQRDRCGDL